MFKDREIKEHQQWLGLLQPVGLVVSPIALKNAQMFVNRYVVELQQQLQGLVGDRNIITDFPTFTTEILGWQPEDLVKAPDTLMVYLPEYGDVLSADYGVINPDNGGWLMLVKCLSTGDNMDEDIKTNKWKVSPQARLERLLREQNISIGILTNNTEIRLVYAPKGESSGHITFPVAAMVEVSGRLILGALEMLLSGERIFNAPSQQRLLAVLEDSRKYQNEVSTQLSKQVLTALWELLTGFQIANQDSKGNILDNLVATEPEYIYGGLITVLLRLVFLLYAEDEGLMPEGEIYSRNYSVTGLYLRLREDAIKYGDIMEQRYGAWAWLLTLFRLVYEGCPYQKLYLPARHGELFNPDYYCFLEGRKKGSKYKDLGWIDPPGISDRVIYNILESLLILNGDRLSYRALDVEQIGSVYESIMGYEIQTTTTPSIGIWSKPKGAKNSVTVVVSLTEILQAKPQERNNLLKQLANCELTGKALQDLKQATTIEDITAALQARISPQTPNILYPGSCYLQPGEERRRSGSHYTPRSLSSPIVAETLKPLLAELGEHPLPEQILNLKICDPAMGTGAFLVETCRQLAEKLLESWQYHQSENHSEQHTLLQAKRLIAERCLYGVDKNPFAVNLAKLSLWLITLSHNKPFTFLDHALKCGDSLLGLTLNQIIRFDWKPELESKEDLPLLQQIKQIQQQRQEIHNLRDDDYFAKLKCYETSEALLEDIRLKGDLIVSAFFAADKNKARKEHLDKYFYQYSQESDKKAVIDISQQLRHSENGLVPFNWEVEFPEVFDRPHPGFDAIVGNPPFLGGGKISSNFGNSYLDWLKVVNPESHGNADLVAHFFRRSFALLRIGGTFGLIATNTISQGDTRNTGLKYICEHGGWIYNAQTRYKWPGLAAVIVSVIHVIKYKDNHKPTPILDGQPVDFISAFLFPGGGHQDPHALSANADKSFQGSIVLGMGFTFDDSNPEATPIAEMQRLIAKDFKNSECIFPYIGGEEVNSSPTHAHHRYVINFGEMSEDEARKYPDLMAIVEEKVKPARAHLTKNAIGRKRAENWWQYGSTAKELYNAIAPLQRVLVTSCVSQHLSFTFLPAKSVFSHALAVFPLPTYSAFTILQSRIHEIWVRFFCSTLEERLRYTPSDCFQTFPFPQQWENHPELEAIGKEYYEYRAALMIKNQQGLTATYNRFHDPDEYDEEIIYLRELHQRLDDTVLSAYGWSDINPICEFLLDYQEEEEETETARTKKKPWRLRWNQDIHNKVLSRLLELNQSQHDAEKIGGKQAKTRQNHKTKSKPKNKTTTNNSIPGL